MAKCTRFTNAKLVVKSAENDHKIWNGKPKGYDVIEVFPIEGTDDCIILLEWLKTGMENQKNLLRIDFQGNLIWEIGDPPIDITSGPLRALETEPYTGVIKVEEKFIVA